MPFNFSLQPAGTQNDRPDLWGKQAVLIAPGAGDQLDASGKYFKYFTIAASGDVTFVPYSNADASPITMTGLPAGVTLPGRIRRITAATATVHGWSD